MLISVEKIRKMGEYPTLDDSLLTEKLDALESAIRAYTHNNFNNRLVRFVGVTSSDSKLVFDAKHLKVGDTIEIAESSYNNGIYTILSINDGYVTLNKDLEDDVQMVTLVKYPKDLIDGALKLLSWNINKADKIGVQSESISRHSVTYFTQDATNTAMGYPVAMLGFLKPYCKARF